jgi:hypothetical protein
MLIAALSIVIVLAFASLIAFIELQLSDNHQSVSVIGTDISGDSLAEKFQPSISQHLDTQQRDLKQILDILGSNSNLEVLLLAALQKRSRSNNIRHFLIALSGNIASVIAGWLLSAFVNPTNVLPFLTHR